MKEYVKDSITKLNDLIAQHPDADVRFERGGSSAMCGCKFLTCDINYIESENTIYLG